MIGPPKDVSPSDLLRTLCEWRPRLPLDVRLTVAPDVELWAQAATSVDIQRCRDTAELASIAVVDESGNRLLTRKAAELLMVSDWAALSAGVAKAYETICPLSGQINSDAWIDVLKTGARTNRVLYAQLAACFDPIVSRSKVYLRQRPDMFFGKPMSEMLDGHLLVFRAVHDLLDH